MMKKLLSATSAVLLIVSLSACGGKGKTGNTKLPTAQSGGSGTDFQKNMAGGYSIDIDKMCETESGYYLGYDAFVFYVDKQSKSAAILCNKPECSHRDDKIPMRITVNGSEKSRKCLCPKPLLFLDASLLVSFCIKRMEAVYIAICTVMLLPSLLYSYMRLAPMKCLSLFVSISTMPLFKSEKAMDNVCIVAGYLFILIGISAFVLRRKLRIKRIEKF